MIWVARARVIVGSCLNPVVTAYKQPNCMRVKKPPDLVCLSFLSLSFYLLSFILIFPPVSSCAAFLSYSPMFDTIREKISSVVHRHREKHPQTTEEVVTHNGDAVSNSWDYKIIFRSAKVLVALR
jgi:hypothetical protein